MPHIIATEEYLLHDYGRECSTRTLYPENPECPDYPENPAYSEQTETHSLTLCNRKKDIQGCAAIKGTTAGPGSSSTPSLYTVFRYRYLHCIEV